MMGTWAEVIAGSFLTMVLPAVLLMLILAPMATTGGTPVKKKRYPKRPRVKLKNIEQSEHNGFDWITEVYADENF